MAAEESGAVQSMPASASPLQQVPAASTMDASVRPAARRARPATPDQSKQLNEASDAAVGGASESADAGVSPDEDGGSASQDTPFFATVELEDGTSQPQLGHGDLWPSCWSDDDQIYTAAGDGMGFGIFSSDVFVAVIEGRPGERGYRGTQLASGNAVSSVWSGFDYNRKPTGMLCQNGELYVAVQDLRRETFEDAPAATIAKSTDKGRTWSWDRTAPMFGDHTFTTIMFLDYGKDSEHAPSDYVYAYGLDQNWAFSEFKPGPTKLFLARVPRDSVQRRDMWQFFAGFDDTGAPRFSAAIAERAPVLEDTRRFYAKPLDPELRFQNNTAINQGGVVYNAPLRRYLFTTWTEYTFELFEAPEPWGPFRLFHSKNFGTWPWTEQKNGGYGTTIPSKLISADGKDMLLQANAWPDVTGADNYSFSLRRLHVEPFAPSQPDNEPSSANLATNERGAVRLVNAARSGNDEVMNDGVRDGADEDSYNGDTKTEDFWGYTWPKAHRVNTVRYTTGRQRAAGGFFETLTVQSRQGTSWVEVPLTSADPVYPGTAATPALSTFTLRFDAITTDGIRIYGKPGGSDRYTSLAELSVHFEE